jgi:hypothetical protein
VCLRGTVSIKLLPRKFRTSIGVRQNIIRHHSERPPPHPPTPPSRILHTRRPGPQRQSLRMYREIRRRCHGILEHHTLRAPINNLSLPPPPPLLLCSPRRDNVNSEQFANIGARRCVTDAVAYAHTTDVVLGHHAPPPPPPKRRPRGATT